MLLNPVKKRGHLKISCCFQSEFLRNGKTEEFRMLVENSLMQYYDIFALKVAKINILQFSLHYNRQIGANSLTWKLSIFL